MAHGTPDWGLVGPKRTTYGLDDMGELAVRLGSPHTWDRRGDVLHWSDFRDGLGAMRGYTSFLLGNVELVTGHARQGAYAIKATTSATATAVAGVSMWLPLPVGSACGVEFCFSGLETDIYWQITLNWHDGTRNWQSRVRYDNVNWPIGQLQYQDGVLGWTNFGDPVYLHADEWPLHVMKMVVDMGAVAGPEYVRVILNEMEYDLRGNPVLNAGLGIMSQMTAYVLLVTQTDDAREGYLDCVMITENEPT